MSTAKETELHSFPDKLIHSFWSKVDKSGDCWMWMASSLKSNGRGQFPNARRYGGSTSPYRFSWQIHFGPIPKGMLICHHCDNPLCVNPQHLFLGTHADNTQDMVSKGRSCKGNRNGQAKATEELITKVREFRGTHQEASEFFGIPRRRIISYRRGDTWNYLGLTPINSNRRGEESFTHKFTDEQMLNISKATPKESRTLAEKYGMSESLRTKIRSKRTDRIRRLLNEA